MSLSRLPYHPTLRHPLTGAPIRAVYVDKRGGVHWPILGGDGTEAEQEAAQKAAAEKAAADKAAADKAAADKAAAEKDDLGFPKDTPVSQMTDKQAAAYYQHQSRKQETRNKELLGAIGNRTPEQVKAEADELERLRNEKRTDSEKAVEEAKRQTRDEVTAEFTPKLVRLAFNTALAHVDETDRKDLIDTLDLSKFIDASGDVDTEKVAKVAEKIAPSGKGTGGHRIDYGAGQRPPGSGGRADAGKAEAERRFGKKKNSDDD